MRGRKPTPTVIRLFRDGGKKPKQKVERVTRPTDELREPPEWLDEEQVAIWHKALKAAPPGLLKRIDESVVVVWVVAYSLFRQAQQDLRSLHLTYTAPQGQECQHPLLVVMKGQASIMQKAAAQLGFSPVDRERISIKPPYPHPDDDDGDIA